MSNEPFFTAEGDRFTPTSIARGPWNPKSLHGRVIAGLLGQEIERRHGDPAFHPARLTVDMYRLPDLSPVEIVTRVVREGKRIKVIDADFVSGGELSGRATCQLLRKGENSPGEVWKPAPWSVPDPESMVAPDQMRPMGGMWSMRQISGQAFGASGPPQQKRTWIKEVRELVGGVPLSPFVRVAVAADFASPIANGGTQGLGYINSDVTVYLHRVPRGEWVGFEVVNHGATDGVAVGDCFLYDLEGPIGMASCTALAQIMQRPPVPPPPA